MPSEAFVIAEIIILIAIVSFLGISTYLFWTRRNDFPIKARAPFKGTFAIVYSISIDAIINVALQLSAQKIMCAPIQIISTICGDLFVLGFGAKILDLCIAYEAEAWKKKMRDGDFDVKKVKLPLSIRIRKIAKGKKKYLFLSAFAAKWLLFWIFAVASTPTAFNSDLLWKDDDCGTVQTITGIDVVINLILVVVAFLAVAKNLKKVEDNHFQKSELKILTVALMVVLLQWIIGTVVNPEIVYSAVGALFQTQIPSFYVAGICMFHIWWRARVFAKRRETQTSFKSDDPDKNSTHSGAVTNSEPVMSPRANNNKNHIEAILMNSEDFEDFEKFLQREFATEELYFLQETYVFQNDLAKLSDDEARTRAQKIFDKYIDEASHLSVNISGAHRKELIESFAAIKSADKEQLAKVFSKSYMEVIHLLATDKFRRYKHDSQYYKMRSAKAELQESLPVTATAVPMSDARTSA
jgi:hypothetical protein